MNKDINHTLIDDDYFDREYKIQDLIPLSTLKKLEESFKKAFLINFMVLLENGEIYYPPLQHDKNHILIIKESLNKKKDAIQHVQLGKDLITLFPIKHELEIIGFLSLIYNKGPSEKAYNIIDIGDLLLTVLNEIISFRYRYILTSGLHGKVVEESYIELKKRAELLEISEQKYRHLAENLEIEVQRKTKEIKETQSQLLQQENLAAIGRLASGMAHEINNPIGFIKSNLVTINEYMNDICISLDAYEKLKSIVSGNKNILSLKTEIKQAVENIETIQNKLDIPYIKTDLSNIISETNEGIQRIAKIISDLREFSCIDLSEKIKMDINMCIKNTLTTMKISLLKNIKIITKLNPVPMTTCYPGKLNQVFMNILLNANQAIGQDGIITITTITKQDSKIKDNHKEYIEIQIQDTGCGIPLEDINRIFEPFFTTRDVGKGIGLGLTIAKDIIHLHKGSLKVESEQGKGSRFIISIPIINND